MLQGDPVRVSVRGAQSRNLKKKKLKWLKKLRINNRLSGASIFDHLIDPDNGKIR